MSQRGYLKSWQGQYFQRRPKSPERRHWKVEILRSLSTGQVSFQVLCRGEPDYLELSLRFRIFNKPDQNGIFFLFFIGPKSNHSLALSGRFPLCIKDPFAYNLSQLWHGFVIKVICTSRPSPNKTKLKFDLCRLIDWPKELNQFKRLNALGPLCLWQCFFLTLKLSGERERKK